MRTLYLILLPALLVAQPTVRPDPWPATTKTTSASSAAGSFTLTFASTTGITVGQQVADTHLGINGDALNGITIQWDTLVTAVGATTVTLDKAVGSGGVASGATIYFTNNPQQPSVSDAYIGIGCTTAYHIDKDCDGYGIGPGLTGPDADDDDASVNTTATALATYGTLANYIQQVKGYTPTNYWYIDSVSGNDTTCLVNRVDLPCATYGKIDTIGTVNKAGYAIIFRAGVHSASTLGNSRGGGTPPYGSSATFGSAIGTGALQGGKEVNAAVTSGSTLPFDSTTGITVGMTVHGPGIAKNTTVTAVAANSITISNPVVAPGLVARGFVLFNFNPVIFMAYPGERVIIDRKSIGFDNKCNSYRADGWTCNAPSHDVVVDGFEWRNRGNNGLGHTWEGSSSYNVWFVNNDCYGMSAGPYSFINLHRWVIENNVIRDMNSKAGGSHSIYLGSRINPKWNLVAGYTSQSDEALLNSNLYIRSNVLYRSGRTCAQHNGPARQYVVDGNICHSFFGATGLDGEMGVRNSYYRNNLVFGGTRGPFTLYNYPPAGGANNTGIFPGDMTNNLIEHNTWVVPSRNFYNGVVGNTPPNFSISPQSPLNAEDVFTGNIFRNNAFINETATAPGLIKTILGTKTCVSVRTCSTITVTTGANGGSPWPIGTQTFTLAAAGGGANAVEPGMTVVSYTDTGSFAPAGTYVASLTYDLTNALTITLSNPITTPLASSGTFNVYGWNQNGTDSVTSNISKLSMQNNLFATPSTDIINVTNVQPSYGVIFPMVKPADSDVNYTLAQINSPGVAPFWPSGTGTMSGNLSSTFSGALVNANASSSELSPGPGYYNFSPAAGSPLLNAGTAGSISVDIRGRTRSATTPSIGAYEYTLSITTTSLSSGTQYSPYSATLAVTGSTGTVTWSVVSGTLHSGLSLNASTGEISGTPTSAASNSITFRATDSVGYAEKTLTLTITSAVNITISPSSLPSGTVGSSYSQTMSASGGTAPYTWAIIGSGVPGLTMSSAGEFAGNPTTGGTYSIVVRATDAAAYTKDVTFSVTIAWQTLTITTSAALPSGIINIAYSDLLNATGGDGSYTWSVIGGVFPAGLSLNSSSGLLSGTPNTAGNYSFTVRVTSGDSQTFDRTFTLIVTPPSTDVSFKGTATRGMAIRCCGRAGSSTAQTWDTITTTWAGTTTSWSGT